MAKFDWIIVVPKYHQRSWKALSKSGATKVVQTRLASTPLNESILLSPKFWKTEIDQLCKTPTPTKGKYFLKPEI